MLQSFFGLVEKASAIAQGKGFGAATVNSEFSQARRLLGGAVDLVVDVGGNVGNYSAAVLRQVPSAEIHVFEPAQSNVAKLRARFSDYANVHIVDAALSSAPGEASLFSDKDGSGLGSLIKRDISHLGATFERTETVRTLSFEDYWSDQLKRRPISIAKVDVEGHELAVFQGFGTALKACSVIQFEFGGCNIDSSSYFRDFWKFFKSNGFDIFRITPFGALRIGKYRERDETFVTANYLAVNCNNNA